MMCAWKELLGILPQKLRQAVDSLGRESMEELRLRINAPPELVMGTESRWLPETTSLEDLNFIIHTASRYSPWTAQTMARGYLTAPGGHRIGLCGEALCRDGTMAGIREVGSMCIRVARDFPGMAEGFRGSKGSVLILGAPGWGKTTLLRDLSRVAADQERVAVVDERGELFPRDYVRGKRMDVLTGCPKPEGIEMVLRTMGPDTIAVDEITGEADCRALIHGANCGVRLLATAHASSVQDLRKRKIYRPLVDQGIFETVVVLHRNRSYHMERMGL